MARKWAEWVHNYCRFGALRPFKAGDDINSGPQVGGVAT